jgi:hypothetical protein
MRVILSFILLLMFQQKVIAQDEIGSVRFIINDSITNKYSDEKLIIHYTKTDIQESWADSTTTFLKDYKTLKSLPKGNYTVTIKSENFCELEITDVVVGNERVTFLKIDFTLQSPDKKEKIKLKFNTPQSTNCE